MMPDLAAAQDPYGHRAAAGAKPDLRCDVKAWVTGLTPGSRGRSGPLVQQLTSDA